MRGGSNYWAIRVQYNQILEASSSNHINISFSLVVSLCCLPSSFNPLRYNPSILNLPHGRVFLLNLSWLDCVRTNDYALVFINLRKLLTRLNSIRRYIVSKYSIYSKHWSLKMLEPDERLKNRRTNTAHCYSCSMCSKTIGKIQPHQTTLPPSISYIL